MKSHLLPSVVGGRLISSSKGITTPPSLPPFKKCFRGQEVPILTLSPAKASAPSAIWQPQVSEAEEPSGACLKCGASLGPSGSGRREGPVACLASYEACAGQDGRRPPSQPNHCLQVSSPGIWPAALRSLRQAKSQGLARLPCPAHLPPGATA